MKDELRRLYELIEDLDTAMFTTRQADGHLRSRAMANQKPASGADLWFVASESSRKLADLSYDPHVNLAYYRDSDRSWISVSGTARATTDRQKVRELYAPDWKVWFPEQGDPRHGTADDPRVVLIAVTVHGAVYLDVNKPRPVLLYEFVKGWITETEPEFGEMHELTEPHRPPSTR
jgi:general stress protein 26